MKKRPTWLEVGRRKGSATGPSRKSPKMTTDQNTSSTAQESTNPEKAKERPVVFHRIIRDTETDRHTLCGSLIPRRRAITSKGKPDYAAVYCDRCAGLESLHAELKSEQTVLTEAALNLLALMEQGEQR